MKATHPERHDTIEQTIFIIQINTNLNTDRLVPDLDLHQLVGLRLDRHTDRVPEQQTEQVLLERHRSH